MFKSSFVHCECLACIIVLFFSCVTLSERKGTHISFRRADPALPWGGVRPPRWATREPPPPPFPVYHRNPRVTERLGYYMNRFVVALFFAFAIVYYAKHNSVETENHIPSIGPALLLYQRKKESNTGNKSSKLELLIINLPFLRFFF